MYLTSKGKVPRQAHVGIPEGLYEEEHGRDGFVGPASHLYRSHPPTGWVRIEGPLRPRAFLCQSPAAQEPVRLMHSQDVHLYLLHRAEIVLKSGFEMHQPCISFRIAGVLHKTS